MKSIQSPLVSIKIPADDKPYLLSDALSRENTNGYVWHLVYRPEEPELTKLAEPYGIHALSIEDCMDDDQIPKMESYPSNTHILFNAFHYIDKELKIEELNIFIGEGFLICVTRSEMVYENLIKLSQRVLGGENGTWQNGPAYMMHHILDKVVDDKVLAIESLEDEINKQEEQLLENTVTFSPTLLQKLRREVLLVRKSLFHEREILTRIIRKDCIFVSEKAIYHFRDIFNHIVRLFELAESYRETVKSLVELNLSIANNQMALAANQTNKTVRRLTFITTIFMPLTLIAGIGGMSEYTMITGADNWRITYPALLLALGLMGLLSYMWIKRFDSKNNE